MNEYLFKKLQSKIGSAVEIVPNQGLPFSAGLHLIDDKHRVVIYLNAKGLKELKIVQDLKLSAEHEKKIMGNPDNFSTILFDDIKNLI